MNLEQINIELDQISRDLAVKLPQLKDAEMQYNHVFLQSILRSGMGNAQSREAEAKLTCDTEGVLRPYEDIKVDVRTLLNRKECLIEIAKNIRVQRGERNQ